jgi:toxin ParE1/3/4
MSGSKKGSSPNRVLLTERALRDIRAIEGYSIEQWGDEIARKYLDKIEAALDRIAERPDLLREESDFAESLRFHRVEKHVLVCDIQDKTVYVLTVVHTSMDIPRRLAKLQPQLLLEADLLHSRVAAKNRRN